MREVEIKMTFRCLVLLICGIGLRSLVVVGSFLGE